MTDQPSEAYEVVQGARTTMLYIGYNLHGVRRISAQSPARHRPPPDLPVWGDAGRRETPSLGDKVQFLSRRESYPDRPDRIEIIETHFSLVFLTDTHAFKLKKPMQGDGFDFRSIAARRHNAVAELRLNRRLAPGVYLGVVPLTLEANGHLALGGPGEPVDWLVRMVRLEADRMFDRRIGRRDWHYAEIEGLAHRLAEFFATARPIRLSGPRQKTRITEELRATLAAFPAAREKRLLTGLKPIAMRLDAFMTRRAASFRQRVHDRRLVDGHGDLRPEHVYLRDMPRIIDCLEFRADLRQLDPLNEIAYLALECRRLGGPDIGSHLLRRYRARTGDTAPRELVRFYAALNALIRARIAICRLAEPGTRTPKEWTARAAAYLAIAAKESRLLSR
jgi:aminoglycoside phosphotransferase family enzyme